MKKTIIIAAATIALNACSTNTRVFEQKENRAKNILVCLDISLSRDSSTIAWFIEVIKTKILPYLGPNSRISVIPVDAGSMTSSEEILRTDFSKNNYHNEFAGLQDEENAAQAHSDSAKAVALRFDRGVSAVISNRRRMNSHSDIIGALKQAEKYYSRDADNVLILLSDMVQSDDRVDFDKHLNNPQDTLLLLSKVEKVDLSNWKIVVLTGKQESTSVEKFEVTYAFWRGYFRSNGVLVDYSSGSSNRLEQLLTEDHTPTR